MISNYRPVSNLPFLSKVLERIVYRQLTNHFNRHNLLPDVPSAYRNVYSNIIDAISNEKMLLLSLLELTATFDTVDHDVLLQRLERTFGFSGSLLQWIRSYLGNRSQGVYLNGKTNIARPAICGVPQGSVLGHFFLHYIQLTSVILFDHLTSSSCIC